MSMPYNVKDLEHVDSLQIKAGAYTYVFESVWIGAHDKLYAYGGDGIVLGHVEKDGEIVEDDSAMEIDDLLDLMNDENNEITEMTIFKRNI